MKLFLFVLLGLVALISCETVESEVDSELSESEDSNAMRVKRAKFSMSNYRGHKQGNRGWTGGAMQEEE
ncbi:hypothetical protein ACHWQZ_G014800 [Mnemiopsis leidyi]